MRINEGNIQKNSVPVVYGSQRCPLHCPSPSMKLFIKSNGDALCVCSPPESCAVQKAQELCHTTNQVQVGIFLFKFYFIKK